MKPDWKIRRRHSTFLRFLFAIFLTAGLLLGSVAQAAEPETWTVYCLGKHQRTLLCTAAGECESNYPDRRRETVAP